MTGLAAQKMREQEAAATAARVVELEGKLADASVLLNGLSTARYRVGELERKLAAAARQVADLEHCRGRFAKSQAEADELRARVAKMSEAREQTRGDMARLAKGRDDLARVAASFIRDADATPEAYHVANAFVLALALVRGKPAEMLPAPARFRNEGPLRAAWRRLMARGGRA